jgi:hypothetical protein
VLAHAAERADAPGPAERLAALLVTILRAVIDVVCGGAPLADLARLEAAAAHLERPGDPWEEHIATWIAGQRSAAMSGEDWPGRRLAAMELTWQAYPGEVIEAVRAETPPPFEVGSMFWHLRAMSEVSARALAAPEIVDLPPHPASRQWPDEDPNEAQVRELQSDPLPARAALLLDAWSAHSVPAAALAELRAEVYSTNCVTGAPVDPGPFYWAARLAALLAARPRVELRAALPREAAAT